MDTEVLIVSTLDPMGPGSLYDALKRCATGPEKLRAIYFDVSGTISFPNDARWSDPENWKGARIKGLKNVVICGDSSPGRIVITGHPYLLEDMQNVTWRGITWALEAPISSAYANYWGPVRATASPGVTCRNVGFINCCFYGGEDETPFGPDDWKERATNVGKTGYECPAFENLNFYRCFFGYGTSAFRGSYHNFGLMLMCVQKSSVVDCFFAHENRRNAQIEGYDNVYVGNIVFNPGSMYFGSLKGSTLIANNLWVPGNETKQTPPHVLPVQVTPSTFPNARTGTCKFKLHGNRRLAYGKIPELTANDITMCDNQMAANGIQMIVESVPPYELNSSRVLSLYPDCWKSLENVSTIGVRGCPYVARAVGEMKVADLKKPWVPGMVRDGHWIMLNTGRLSDLGIPFPGLKPYLTLNVPSYERLVAGNLL